MSQQISITIDGKDGQILPETVVKILSSVFETLASIDASSWAVGTRRVKWHISAASLVNPLTLTAIGDPINQEHGEPKLVETYLKGLQQIQKKKRPNGFTIADIRRTKDIGEEAVKMRSISIAEPDKPALKVFTFTPELLASVKAIIERPKQVSTEYGSIEGTLILIANDPLKENARAKLRERHAGNEVDCDANPKIAAELAHFVNRETRVVLYGDIMYEDTIPKKIRVEGYTTILSESQLPTLEDIHAMKFRLPGGQVVEEYLDEMRGDD